jgi:hypothetical protein
MNKAIRGLFLRVLLPVFCLVRLGAGQAGTPTTDPALLPRILEQTAVYCERLKGMALDFVCLETIREADSSLVWAKATQMFPGSRALSLKDAKDLKITDTKTKKFVYDFQLIKKGDEFTERRTLLEEDGRPKKTENATLSTRHASAKYLVFGPVGFLSKTWQPFFRYEILGTEIEGKSTAWVIRASPPERREENYYHGRIWIDQSDFSILKIEWEPLAEQDAPTGPQTPEGVDRKWTWVVTYDVVKNGIRFPGFQTIQEDYISTNGKSHRKYLAEYRFDSFKFFTVESAVVIK